MIRFVARGFQSVFRSVISYSSRQIRSVMAATGSNGETDLPDDLKGKDANDCFEVSDSESDIDLSNGTSVTLSPSKTFGDGGDVSKSVSAGQKRQLSVGSGSETSVLGHEKERSLRGVLFAKEQPKRLLHCSLWNSSEKEYRTREQVVRNEKGKRRSVDFGFSFGKILSLNVVSIGILN